MKASATYSPTKWDEKTCEPISDTMKVTRTSATFAFTGQMEGTASVEYVMFYQHYDGKDPHKSTASYTGLLRFQGKLNGKAGSFAMEDKGSFEGGAAQSALILIPGSGTGDLKGIAGTGKYSASPKGCTCELNYELQ